MITIVDQREEKRIDSLTVAELLGMKHESFLRNIAENYQWIVSGCGHVQFKTISNGKIIQEIRIGSIPCIDFPLKSDPERIAYLTEDQLMYVLSTCRNGGSSSVIMALREKGFILKNLLRNKKRRYPKDVVVNVKDQEMDISLLPLFSQKQAEDFSDKEIKVTDKIVPEVEIEQFKVSYKTALIKFNQGVLLYESGNPKGSLPLFFLAHSIYKEIKDTDGEIDCLAYIASSYKQIAKSEIKERLKISNKLEVEERKIIMKSALEFYLKLLNKIQEVKSSKKTKSSKREVLTKFDDNFCLKEIERIYTEIGEWDGLITIYKDRLNVKGYNYNVLTELIFCYLKANQKDSAIEWIKNTWEFLEKTEDSFDIFVDFISWVNRNINGINNSVVIIDIYSRFLNKVKSNELLGESGIPEDDGSYNNFRLHRLMSVYFKIANYVVENLQLKQPCEGKKKVRRRVGGRRPNRSSLAAHREDVLRLKQDEIVERLRALYQENNCDEVNTRLLSQGTISRVELGEFILNKEEKKIWAQAYQLEYSEFSSLIEEAEKREYRD